MSELSIQRCDRCGTGLFPDHLRCPRCGACSFTRVPAGHGIVEQETTIRDRGAGGERRVRLGSVRLAAGPVAIARLGEGVAAGAVVRLLIDSGGAVWGRRDEAAAGPARSQ